MFAVGETLQGRYRIVRKIGAGGMATVYEGENLLIRRRVAIKVMREEALERPELRARFELEAQIASQIPSDHITEVLDLGELDDGRRFIVMEYLLGESLAARLERVQRFDPGALLGLVRQVLVALGAAHRAGVIHRDVKPENVFILSEKAGRRDFVKLLDFGISKLRPAGAEISLTQSGVFMGTPSYMAPEQMAGERPSALWDLYAVGLILYRGLTGEAPFQSQGMHDLVYKMAVGTFARPSERVVGIDPALDALVCRAMARLPQQRFQNAEQFISALDDWLAVPRSVEPLPMQSEPLRAPGATPSPPRSATPILEAAATLRDALPPSAEFGVSAQRRVVRRRLWAALGCLLLAATALFAWWRPLPRDGENTAPSVETEALEPTAPAAATAAPSAVAIAPVVAAAPAPPTVSPVVAIVPSIVLAGAAGSVSEPRSVAPAERRSHTAATIPKPATPAPRASSQAKAPRPVVLPPTPRPGSHAEDSNGNAHPDWGY